MVKLYLWHFCFLVFVFHQECQSLATGAVYLIQNQGTKKCITSGPVIGNKTKTLFREGLPLTTACYNNLTDDSSYFGQQWIVRIEKEDPLNITFGAELAMKNTVYNDTSLNATFHGELVAYFPHLVKLKGKGFPGNEKVESHEFMIIDPVTQQCLTDEIGDQPKPLKFMSCTKQSKESSRNEVNLQRWNFTLINEIEMVREQLERMKNLTNLATVAHPSPPHIKNPSKRWRFNTPMCDGDEQQCQIIKPKNPFS